MRSSFLKFVQKEICVLFHIRKFHYCTMAKNSSSTVSEMNEDDKFKHFESVCEKIASENSYKSKSEVLRNFFQKGSSGKGFNGDLLLWLQMLIPGATQRVYNVQNKQMLIIFSELFSCDRQSMEGDLEQMGDISLVLPKYFDKAKVLKPKSESTLYLQEVDAHLEKLTKSGIREDQSKIFRDICKEATTDDLKMIIRLIKQDLRINAGARHILDAFGADAYPTYQSSKDLDIIVRQFGGQFCSDMASIPKKAPSKLSLVKIMTPISPMLANACKSVEEAFKKSPSGLFSEVKYDGERVQIHKKGSEFRFFSRNLKPVTDHKIKRFHEYIPKAFPGANDMILDSEIILVDKKSGELLPFGSLGTNKKKEYAAAEVCLFVFDLIYFDGKDLTDIHFGERRKILENNIKPIKSCVQLSESYFLKTKNELSIMTAKVLKANLEGVVLKSPTSTYQPGKRGWLKVKKDYLFGGQMADTADLVVLGAWFGSGKKGGTLSIFLMGCYDPRDRLWKTVTKVHGGLDDAKCEEVHSELMPLMERADPNKVPRWLLCNKPLVPNFLAKDPLTMPVWEITGAEFTKSESHTASGISIRFPRITKLREDKSAEHANDLPYLEKMFKASKKEINVDLLIADCDDEELKKTYLEIDSKINLNGSLTGASSKSEENEEEPSTTKSYKRSSIQAFFSRSSDGPSPKIAKKENSSAVTSKTENSSPVKSKTENSSPKKESPSPKELKKESPSPKESKKESSSPKKERSSPKEPTKESSSPKEQKKESSSAKEPKEGNSSLKEPKEEGSSAKKAKKESTTPKTSKKETSETPAKKTSAKKETSSKKQLTLNSFFSKPKTENKKLFSEVSVYLSAELDKDEDLLKAFTENGGSIVKDPKDAKIALYASIKSENVNLDNIRAQYDKNCRHLSIDWLKDSIKDNELKSYPVYAVTV